MWFKEYKDYPRDTTLIKEKVEPGHGIIGCEMHEINGWGSLLHQPIPKKKGFLHRLILRLFSRGRENG